MFWLSRATSALSSGMKSGRAEVMWPMNFFDETLTA